MKESYLRTEAHESPIFKYQQEEKDLVKDTKDELLMRWEENQKSTKTKGGWTSVFKG